jgi:hypothetical protein
MKEKAMSIRSLHAASFVALAVLLMGGAAIAQAATTTAASAAAPTSAAKLVVQPVEPFIVGPLAVSDITSSTATLKISTTVDLACVVVFGAANSCGRLALDSDMGASAHREHRVLMRGLEPDTVYRYRLQGSAPDGTLYASNTMTFRTAALSGRPDALGVNVATVARGARVTRVSSEFSSAFGAVNAIDGNASTEWSTAGDGNDALITVTLPKPVTVSGFGLWTRTMGSSAQIRRFEVLNENGDRFGPFDVADAKSVHRFAATGSGRSFTFRVLDSSGGNTGAVEVEVLTKLK